MGEEWALQLAALGFNVIIQGRNKGKLETVRSQIHKLAPDADVRLLVTEATVYPNPALTEGLAKLLDEPDVRLTVVISNLGVNELSYPKLDEQSSESVAGIVLANAFYPAEVARICLPHLKRHEPSLLVTVTSIGCWAPPP
jgi:17beta-estradiol 17-dehydrogenase / very-long-chain 3-oxoacyl-CoA reductase